MSFKLIIIISENNMISHENNVTSYAVSQVDPVVPIECCKN